jgi:carboxymethylenebutenolidase
MHETVSIRTGDGDCPAYVFTPASGTGPWPAVIFFMDGLGIRPILFEMSQRIADDGYVVLMPDTYYRGGPYEPFNPKAIFAEGNLFDHIGKWFMSTNPLKAAADTKDYIAYLDSRSDVAGEKIGTTGYCMGGAMALAAAGTYPDRIAAAASFHGGNLASDEPTSPHLLAGTMKGRIYVAGADEDPYYPLEMHERLKAAFDAAGTDYEAEIYPGALHGWTMADFPIYNEPAAERHFDELHKLYAATLK